MCVYVNNNVNTLVTKQYISSVSLPRVSAFGSIQQTAPKSKTINNDLFFIFFIALCFVRCGN